MVVHACGPTSYGAISSDELCRPETMIFMVSLLRTQFGACTCSYTSFAACSIAILVLLHATCSMHTFFMLSSSLSCINSYSLGCFSYI